MVSSFPKKHGFGTGLGNGAHRRGHRLIRDSIQGITKSSIRKMARRGGVTRIEHTIYVTIRDLLQHKLREILSVAIQYVEHRHAKTVTSLDIVYALRHIPGISPVYGSIYSSPTITASKPKTLTKPSRPTPPPPDETPAMPTSSPPSEGIKAEPTTETPDAPSSSQDTGFYSTARILAWAIHVAQVGITDRHILEDLSFFHMSSSSSSSDL